MADVKLSALPTVTTMATTDLLPFTSDPGVTPISKNITMANLLIAFENIVEHLIHDTVALDAEDLYGGRINTYGQDDNCILTLPAAVLGMNFTVFLGTTVAKYLRITPDAGDKIFLDGVAGANGEYVGIVSASEGNHIQFSTATTSGGVDWVAVTTSGPWIAE